MVVCMQYYYMKWYIVGMAECMYIAFDCKCHSCGQQAHKSPFIQSSTFIINPIYSSTAILTALSHSITYYCPSAYFLLYRFCTYKDEAKCGPLEPKKEEIIIEVKDCDPDQCQLPYCYCSRDGSKSPIFDRDPQRLPQMVTVKYLI